MNQKQNQNRTRKKKTILILSIITSLFFGVMGYEIVTSAIAKCEKETSPHKFAILSKPAAGYSGEQKQYASMHAQNQHLTNKVLALKEQALETARRLNMVQLSVFAARK